MESWVKFLGSENILKHLSQDHEELVQFNDLIIFHKLTYSEASEGSKPEEQSRQNIQVH